MVVGLVLLSIVISNPFGTGRFGYGVRVLGGGFFGMFRFLTHRYCFSERKGSSSKGDNSGGFSG